MQTHAQDWLFTKGVVQFMRPGTRQDPPHFDGGASLLLVTVALFGRRRVRCFQAEGRPDVALACDPGS
eukprot:4665204-Alexandrium_andersonii.AAC.1